MTARRNARVYHALSSRVLFSPLINTGSGDDRDVGCMSFCLPKPEHAILSKILIRSDDAISAFSGCHDSSGLLTLLGKLHVEY